MIFSEALQALKDGKKIKRRDWKVCWVIDDIEELVVINLELNTAHNFERIYLDDLEDFAANDWEVVND
jgi:hypothetical protein